jgi:hypothetical protein
MEGEVIGELEETLHGEHFTVVQHLGRWRRMDGMNWDRQPEPWRGNFLQQRSVDQIAFLHSH